MLFFGGLILISRLYFSATVIQLIYPNIQQKCTKQLTQKLYINDTRNKAPDNGAGKPENQIFPYKLYINQLVLYMNDD